MFDSVLSSIGGDLVSGAFSLFGGSSANRASKKEAQRNRDFQERMANTAYQRATADMKLAGINPMLAYMKGGADTPSGNMAPIRDISEGAASSAGNMTSKVLAARNITASTAKTEAEKINIEAQTANTEANTAATIAQMPQHPLKTNLLGAEINNAKQQLQNLLATQDLTIQQTAKTMREFQNLATKNKLDIASIKNVLANTKLTYAQITKIAPEIQKIIADTNKTTADRGWSEMKGVLGNFLNSAGDSKESLGEKMRKAFDFELEDTTRDANASYNFRKAKRKFDADKALKEKQRQEQYDSNFRKYYKGKPLP
ncbi:MAG: DNA pilot protein [Microvirus sp.]|nr:MAG: DNA pilot protein [Microvirus sp.]